MAIAPIEMTIPGVLRFTDIVLDLYPLGSDTAGATGLTLTYQTNRGSTYRATTTAALSGVYLAVARNAANTAEYGFGYVSMDDSTDLHVVGIDVPGKVLGAGNADIVAVGARVDAAGSGPYALTVSVVDEDAAAIEGASVSLSRNGEQLSGTTDVNGEVVFSVVAATWTLAVVATGFAHTPQTVVVTAAASVEAEMVANTIPDAPSADLVTGYCYCYSSAEVVAAGIVIYGRKTDGNAGDGYSGSGEEFTFTSVTGGLASRSFKRGATYEVWRSVGVRYSFTAPAVGANFQLPEHLGSP